MQLKRAAADDVRTVFRIARDTISAVYYHYYPRGAVDYFLALHSEKNIEKSITEDKVYIITENGAEVGTVTVRENEILRFFILPEHQGRGLGNTVMDFLEEDILKAYGVVRLDASMSANEMYERRGYRPIRFNRLRTDNGDYLCWYEMEKTAG